jgi:uncharacterized protein (DUF342 family)
MPDSDTPSADSSGMDEEDLRSIEDQLFDLEDELIEMQGTTIRTFEQEEEEQFEGLSDFYLLVEEESKSESDDDEDLELSERLDRLVDEVGSQQEVKPGQLIMADLRGEGINYRPGQYVIEADQGKRFFAARSGHVTLNDGVLHVLAVKRVEGDVNSDVGDIRYDGSVLVEGSVADNRFIEATGNVWVHGGVGKADIKAGGDVIVQGGIKTGEKNLVEAHGNVFAEFIENSCIEAGKNVLVKEIIMHSDVEADQDVILIDDDGSIVGGEIESGRRIIVDNLGSVSYPETIVRMAAAGALQEELESLKNKERRLSSEEEETAKNVENLLDKKGEEGLTPKDEERLRNLRFDLNHLRQDIQEINQRIEEIQEELDSDIEREVLVSGTAFPNVELHIGGAVTEVDEERKSTLIHEDEGEINFDSYRDVDFDLDLETDLEPQTEAASSKRLPAIDELRRHLKTWETSPILNREEQFRHYLGLSEDTDVVLIDVGEVEGLETEDEPDQPEQEEEEETSEDEDFDPKKWWCIEVRPGERSVDVRRYYTAKHTDSVKVRCETVREGVLRAAEYFDVHPDELAVKIIEEGKQGYFGTSLGQADYLIRAVKKESLREQQEDDPELEGMDILEDEGDEEDVAGFINLDNTTDGLMLTVYPPQGDGLPVSFDGVKEELEECGYTQEIDWPTVEETVEAAEGEEVRIGPRQRNPEIDGSFSVTVSDDETEAYLTVIPPKEDGVPVTLEEVVDQLENQELNYDRSIVESIFEEERWEEDVLIAEGRDPEHGEDGWIEMKVEAKFEDDVRFIEDEEELRQANDEEDDENDSDEGLPVKPYFDEDEEDASTSSEEYDRVDHKQSKKVQSVSEGDLIARVHSATVGQDGETVKGEPIPATDGADVSVSAGENTTVSGDGEKITADREGKVVLEDGTFVVEPVLVIEGDLDYETGNVEFDGVVIVEGFVQDGFQVEAGRRIEAGSVGKATLKSGGDVIIEKGMAGKEEGSIEAEGDVYARYFENANVRAEGSILVEKSILHSQVDAGEYVVVDGDRRGDIVGGSTRAGKGISVQGLGSDMTSQTQVEVGITPEVRDHIAELESKIDEQKEKFEKIRLGLKGINEQAEELGGEENLPDEKKEKKEQLTNVARSIKFKIESLSGELKDLRNEIQSSEGGQIAIEGTIYAGVKITIQTASLHVTEQYENVRYVLENGEVVKMEYEPIEHGLERPE